MKDLRVLLLLLFFSFGFTSYSQEYKIVTTIESISLTGWRYSRMIDTKSNLDYKKVTVERKGEDNNPDAMKWLNAEIDFFEETKLKSLSGPFGVSFENIAFNDAMVIAKMNELAKEGWRLAFVTGGIGGDGGDDNLNGALITRYVFYKGEK